MSTKTILSLRRKPNRSKNHIWNYSEEGLKSFRKGREHKRNEIIRDALKFELIVKTMREELGFK